MQPKYRVLNLFPEGARQQVATRAFSRRNGTDPDNPYVCKDGMCVMGALLRTVGRSHWATPNAEHVLDRLGVADAARDDLRQEIDQIIQINDGGKLRTRAAVRELLGVPIPGAAGAAQGGTR
jgi:hypothetical protein